MVVAVKDLSVLVVRCCGGGGSDEERQLGTGNGSDGVCGDVKLMVQEVEEVEEVEVVVVVVVPVCLGPNSEHWVKAWISGVFSPRIQDYSIRIIVQRYASSRIEIRIESFAD